MAERLIQKTVNKITVDYCRLSIVKNPDGFLTMDDVVRLLENDYCITVISGSNLQLRLHYELEAKLHPEQRYVYLCDQPGTLIPDMVKYAFITDFSVNDLFPLFADKTILKGLSLEVLSLINLRCGIRRIPLQECSRLVLDAKSQIEDKKRQSADHFRQRMSKVYLDWENFTSINIEDISSCMVDSIRYDAYEAIAPQLSDYNNEFQSWLDKSYFATLNSNHLLRPKSVNKILPYIADKHDRDDKVALVVIDGLAYWQYIVLQRYLKSKGIFPSDNFTLAWIPTITMLSRQAIFRGDMPLRDYVQNPSHEQKLWKDYWESAGISSMAIQYISDKDKFIVNDGVRRLAYVTVEMDEKMHSSSDYRDLLSLTENWCPRITERIQELRDKGYVVYLTTDHGNILSEGWSPISADEKVYLYKDGSRGKRHLIYNTIKQKDIYYNNNKDEINLLSHDNWLSVRDGSCFEKNGLRLITHGGSHFWEVVIPFVTI